MNPRTLKIETPKGTRLIGPGHPAFVIAEVSANHGQNYERAEQIVRLSAKAGADAVKLQTYKPETMTIDCDNEYFIVKGESSPGEWKNQTLFELYKKAFTPYEWHAPLKKLAEELGLVFFSTPFDPTAVDFLETLHVPLYKVASYEVTDLPLLKRIARTGKPVIMSVGFAALDEIEMAMDCLRSEGAKDIAILYCVTNYTKDPDEEHTNLATMADLAERFSVVTGFSDNTGGIDIPLQAAMMGAAIIEKHVVADDTAGALDADFSLGPQEFGKFMQQLRRAEKIAGKPAYGSRNENEKYFQKFRRSIFSTRDIRKGEVLNESNIKIIRPANGLEPKHWEEVLGKKATADIKKGTPLNWNLIQQ